MDLKALGTNTAVCLGGTRRIGVLFSFEIYIYHRLIEHTAAHHHETEPDPFLCVAYIRRRGDIHEFVRTKLFYTAVCPPSEMTTQEGAAFYARALFIDTSGLDRLVAPLGRV